VLRTPITPDSTSPVHRHSSGRRWRPAHDQIPRRPVSIAPNKAVSSEMPALDDVFVAANLDAPRIVDRLRSCRSRGLG
jgi:hypothetical protein